MCAVHTYVLLCALCDVHCRLALKFDAHSESDRADALLYTVDTLFAKSGAFERGVSVFTCVCVWLFICVCMLSVYVCIHVSVFIYVYMWVFMCICVWVFTCVCVWVFMCVCI